MGKLKFEVDFFTDFQENDSKTKSINQQALTHNFKLLPKKAMADSIVAQKSFQFAVKIVKLYLFLKNEKQEYVLAKQLIRSGTPIGANAEEAVAAQSRADFVYKLQIALKEARETSCWLR